ncbi:MAG: hypothetical protein IPP17_07040 [Bacteroidetes bacterium]|nr:hypothetical protein [Bacteroidota bacterium]
MNRNFAEFSHQGTKTQRKTWCLGALVARFQHSTWCLRAFVARFQHATWCLGALLAISLLVSACSNNNKVSRSFYHWKTRFAPTPFEKQRLQDLGVTKLYIKYFDVDFLPESSEAMPQAKVEFAEMPEMEVIPTIFITNRTLQKVDQKDCPALADKIHRLIFKLHPKELPAPKEVQIDCDWSQNSKEAYFSLLKRLQQRLDSADIQLSATIRLHQLKYPKQTGIPPVDRGALMFYNMGDLDNPNEDNSILNIAQGAQYLDNATEYSMPLDVALPIFAWGVLIRRGQPIRLLNNLRMESVKDIVWITETAANKVRIDTNHYFAGQYLYAGDEIRMEDVSSTSLLEAASLLAGKMKTETRSVMLYHLDSLTLSHYSKANLDSTFTAFE